MPTPIAVYVMCVILLATLIRSTIGFGEALVAVPLLALRIPIAVATPVAVAASVVVAGLILLKDHRRAHLRGAAGLVVSAVIGIPLGLLLLKHGNDRAIKALLGLILISFACYSLFAKPTLHTQADHWGWLLAFGFCSGVMGGAYGMNGPPLAIYGALRKWSPRQFRATLQAYFFPASLFALVGYAAAGIWQPAVTGYCLVSLPGILVGIVIGNVLHDRLRGDSFFKYVYVGLIVIGAVLLAQAAKI